MQNIHVKSDNICKKTERTVYEFNKFFSTVLLKNVRTDKKWVFK